MRFDRDDISTLEYIVYEDKIFETEADFISYLDSCDCQYVTDEFILDADDHRFYGNVFDDDDEDAIEEFNHAVDALLIKYDISYALLSRSYSGIKYELSGTYGNLKKFAKEYSPYIGLDNPGEALADAEFEADIDFDTGDDSFVAGKLYL